MIMRGRVKVFWPEKQYGWLEVTGAPDHFIHLRQHKELLFVGEELVFGQLSVPDLPKEDDWLVFESSQVPGKEQPQAMPWAYADEIPLDFEEFCRIQAIQYRRLGDKLFERLQILGLA